MSQPTSSARLARLGRLALKELREILRDRRTIVTLVLMPLLMYPLLSVAFQQFFLSQMAHVETPRYTVGFPSNDDAAFFVHVLKAGGLSVIGNDDPDPPAPPRGVAAKPIVVVGLVEKLDDEVREFRVDVGLKLRPDQRVHFDPQAELDVDADLIFRDDSVSSRAAADLIEKHLTAASQKFLMERLKVARVEQASVPVRATRRSLAESTSISGTNSIIRVIPFILILMTVTGAVYPAIDLTAGERERGTLEVLVAAPIPRISLLFAKYIAVLTVALLTAAANLLTMALTVRLSGLSGLLFGESGLSLGVISAIFALLLLFAAFFSAVLLTITSAARSFKEAQAYLIPLMLVSLAPGILSQMPDVRLSGLLLVTPLANIVLLGRDLLALQANGTAAAVVVISTAAYAAAAISLAARIFGAESVLYSEQTGWSDLLRRPHEPRAAPSLTAGLVCLAVMVPVYYALMGAAGTLGRELQEQLLVGLVTTAVVFGVLPGAFIWRGRIRARDAFALRGPSPVAIVAAMLLGLSLWTLDLQVVKLSQMARGASLDASVIDRVMQFAEKLRELPVAFVIVCIAVVPAIFEEAFFRGYLFSALRTRIGVNGTILTSAALFGLFHVIMPNPLASERLLSSAMLGVVLGWVRWRSGSLVPGIILHVCHNGLLALVAYYEPQLTARGWDLQTGLVTSDKWLALPAAWLVAGACLAAAGSLLFAKFNRPADA